MMKTQRAIEKELREYRITPSKEKVNQSYDTNDIRWCNHRPRAKRNTQKEDSIYEKTAQLYGSDKQNLIANALIKKYIIFTKKNFAPILNEDAVNFLSTFWIKMRPKEGIQQNTPHYSQNTWNYHSSINSAR